MRLTVFTSNQPRHIACLEALQDAGHEVTAVIEPKSWVPGHGSDVLTRYWGYVRVAEHKVFGLPRPWTGRVLAAPMGEVSHLDWLPLSADRLVVFGSSFITGPLADLLLDRGALNLHLGISPEYRGSACNFWAEYDGRPEFVGAQVQRLGKGVDAGEILCEAIAPRGPDPFLRGMRAADCGIKALVYMLAIQERDWHPIRPNDPAQTIRYSRGADFTEAVAKAYLERLGQ